MSTQINGMEMPEECSRCPLISEAGYCNGTKELTSEEIKSLWIIVGRPSWCPLVEIPPHGRLIDADEMCKKIDAPEYETSIIIQWVNEQPTIIEAEPPKECKV